MDMSRLCGLTPRPTDSAPCGSKSTRSTRRPYSARAAPRLMVLVVLPTPPFWLHIARIRAGPCRCRGFGSRNRGTGRPVGPTPSASPAANEAGIARAGATLFVDMRIYLPADLLRTRLLAVGPCRRVAEL